MLGVAPARRVWEVQLKEPAVTTSQVRGEMVSFVVIAYNEAPNIKRTVKAITCLEALEEYELIVVDDGSWDGTGKIVTEIALENPSVQLIDLGKNCGRGYARRRGVGAARGGLIATVDADIVLPPDWLIRARIALRDHDAVGGTAIPDGDVQYIYKRFHLVPRIIPGTTRVNGSNGLYRREVFDVVNFNPDLKEGEDSALNYAMDEHHILSATVPGLLVKHEESKSFATSLKWLFDVGRGATRQLFSYRQVRGPDIATGAFIVMVALGALAAYNGYGLIGAALPIGLILGASIQHVRSRFAIRKSQWHEIICAIAVDGVLLVAYFAGRVVGLTGLWSRSRPRTGSPDIGSADGGASFG